MASPRSVKLTSPEMLKAIEALATHGELVRIRGGFWTYRGCKIRGVGIPAWFVSTTTIYALLHLGVVSLTGKSVARLKPGYEEALRDMKGKPDA